MSTVYDQNGRPLYARPRRLHSGVWAAVCYSTGPLAPTGVHVGLFRTREDARSNFLDGAQDYLGPASPDEVGEYERLTGTEGCWY